jgi:hypothetical protein
MNKKKIIIIAASIAVIALVLFLFWDKIKPLFVKPTTTNIVDESAILTSGAAVPPSTKITPVITINKPVKYDVLKASEDTYVFKAGANNSITSSILKSVKAGASIGVYMPEHDTPNYYYVNIPNMAPGFVKKSTAII